MEARIRSGFGGSKVSRQHVVFPSDNRRILALAGFDPNAAIEHFSQSVADLDEIRPVEDGDGTLTGRMFKLWTWATHPTPEQRNEAIREEMKRWSNVEGKDQVK